MIRQLGKTRRKQVVIDIDTQNDYFLDDGRARVGNRRRILSHIRRVMALARVKKIPVISISVIHPQNNGGYCVDGTKGAEKICYTLLSNRASFSADNNTDLPIDVLRRYRQIILHKRCVDPFDEPRIDRLLSEVCADWRLPRRCRRGNGAGTSSAGQTCQHRSRCSRRTGQTKSQACTAQDSGQGRPAHRDEETGRHVTSQISRRAQRHAGRK